MIHLLILTIATTVYGGLTWLIWVRSRSVEHILGLAALYYWTLLGAWPTVLGITEGISIASDVPPITANAVYRDTLILYSAFLISCATVLALHARMPAIRSKRPLLVVDQWRLLFASITCAAAGALVMSGEILGAIASNRSLYYATRFNTNPFYTVHLVLNTWAVTFAGLAASVAISRRPTRYIDPTKGRIVKVACTTWCLILGAYCAILGNRSEILYGSFVFLAMYSANNVKPRRKLLVAVSGPVLVLLFLINTYRSTPVFLLVDQVPTTNAEFSWAAAATSYIQSPETTSAHYALYGCLLFDVPMVFGESIRTAALQVVPRVVWPDRPPSIYEYYIGSIGAKRGVGYAMHQAAGWYLSFGVAGIFIGGLMLGEVWSWLCRLQSGGSASSTKWASALRAMGPVIFLAYLPSMIRMGPEGYKGLVIDSWLLPSLIVALCVEKLGQASGGLHARNPSRGISTAIRGGYKSYNAPDKILP